jgi:hypothetical protein
VSRGGFDAYILIAKLVERDLVTRRLECTFVAMKLAACEAVEK